MAWWVIEDAALEAALDRVQSGDEPGVVLAELYANSDTSQVAPEE